MTHVRSLAPGITDANAARAAMMPVTNAAPCCTRKRGLVATTADDIVASIITATTTR